MIVSHSSAPAAPSTPLPSAIRHPPASPLLIYTALTMMILLWTLNYLVAKEGFKQIDSLTLSLYRITLATVLMLAIYFFKQRSLHPVAGSPPVYPDAEEAALRQPFTRRDYLNFARLGLLGVV